MADETTPPQPPAEITNFAQFEAAGGKYNAPAEPAKPAAPAEPVEAVEANPEADTAEQPEADKTEKKPPKPKPSLSEEHAKLLKEVTELRRQRRELQAPAGRPTSDQPLETQPPQGAAQPDDKPVRPKLSTFQGTLEEYEAEVEKYEEKQRAYIERQWERKQSEQQAKATQQKVTEVYGQKLAEHLKEHPEYDAEIAQTPMSPLMVDIVLHEGPALGQALIEDKDEARRIQVLPRDIQIFEMGKLAAHLRSNGALPEASLQTPQPVKVPARLNATGSSVSAAAKPDHGAKSFAQWEEVERRLAKRK
jgi:hypothetical protein